MWLSVVSILTPHPPHPPGFQGRGGKARDIGCKASLEPSVRPLGALPKSQAPKGRADGPRCCAALILLATRWRWCPSRPREPRWAGRVRQATGVKETEMEDGAGGWQGKAQRLSSVRALSGVRVLQTGRRSWLFHVPEWSRASYKRLPEVQFLTREKEILLPPQRAW